MSSAPSTGGTRREPTPRLAAGWREHLVIRLEELETRTARLADSDFKQLAASFLHRAREAVERPPSLLGAWNGVDVERAWVSAHAAEVAYLRGADPVAVTAMLPSVVADCAAVLPSDPRVAALRKIAEDGRVITAQEQTLAADMLDSAHETSDAQHVQLRSFRNLLLGTTAVLSVFALLIGIVASLSPGAFAVCDTAAKTAAATCPTGRRHPTGGDVFVVELLGLFAAAITSAVAIRKLSGTSTPYAVPLASLMLKLPIGALTALGGLMLLRAGFGPPLTALNQPQLAAYALIFGASQQLFMQFVDKQAKVVLDATTTPGDKSTTKKPAT